MVEVSIADAVMNSTVAYFSSIKALTSSLFSVARPRSVVALAAASAAESKTLS